MGFRGLLIKTLSFFILISFSCWADNHSNKNSDVLFKKASDLVKKREYREAIYIFETLAKASEHDAQYNLALLLKSGKGTPRNYTMALYWAYLSKLGDIEEAKDLTEDLMDLLPEKTIEEIRLDVKGYLEGRVNEGSKDSIMELGKYFLEIVSEKEYAEAYKWFTIGAALGLGEAIKLRDQVEKELQSEDVVSKQKEALELFESFVDKTKAFSSEEIGS